MMNLKSLCAIVLASLSVVAVGCGSGDGGGSSVPTPPSYGSKSASSNHFFIQTSNTSTSGGSGEAWGEVSVTGYAHPHTIQCDITNQNCIPNVGDDNDVVNGNEALNQNEIPAFTTNDYGQANFYTDAQSAIWTFYGNGLTNSNCVSTYASFITLENSGDGSQVLLRCGSNPASMIATPSDCMINYNVKPPINTCTDTISLSFPPPISSTNTLPVGAAMVAANYDSSGDSLAQSSVTASTTTSIVVPTPTTVGTTYLVVQDATGNVIGASEFTRTVAAIPKSTPPKGGNPN